MIDWYNVTCNFDPSMFTCYTTIDKARKGHHDWSHKMSMSDKINVGLYLMICSVQYFLFLLWEFLQWLKKIGAVHLVKSYGGEGRKYPE